MKGERVEGTGRGSGNQDERRQGRWMIVLGGPACTGTRGEHPGFRADRRSRIRRGYCRVKFRRGGTDYTAEKYVTK